MFSILVMLLIFVSHKGIFNESMGFLERLLTFSESSQILEGLMTFNE